LVTRIKIKNILYKEIIVVTDTISDMLTRIRNANMVKHQIVQIPSTKMSLEIARILKEEGFVEDFESYEENKRKYLLMSLKYIGKARTPVIVKIERISKPGLRVYSSSKKLPKILDNLGVAIISTSKGLMTNLKAKELGIGGEVLCSIW
jgi:small subunit ribosomal protein S8